MFKEADIRTQYPSCLEKEITLNQLGNHEQNMKMKINKLYK